MSKRLLDFLLARAQERSSVAGLVAAVAAVLGMAFPQAATDAVVTFVVAAGGLAAVLIPGGK
jgi:hypothetical protein